MAIVPVYNLTGQKTGALLLDEAVFGVAVKSEVIHQVYEAERANMRFPWADTKNRGEVSGGGKKPWQQKGTGRARHGSIRSPIWKGGGVTFGPLSVRNYKQKVNKKMSVAAVRMCLADKAGRNALIVIESLPTSHKTKDMAALRQQLPNAKKSALFLVEAMADAIKQATQNMKRIGLARVQDVCVVDLLHYDTIIMTKTAFQALTQRVVS